MSTTTKSAKKPPKESQKCEYCSGSLKHAFPHRNVWHNIDDPYVGSMFVFMEDLITVCTLHKNYMYNYNDVGRIEETRENLVRILLEQLPLQLFMPAEAARRELKLSIEDFDKTFNCKDSNHLWIYRIKCAGTWFYLKDSVKAYVSIRDGRFNLKNYVDAYYEKHPDYDPSSSMAMVAYEAVCMGRKK